MILTNKSSKFSGGFAPRPPTGLCSVPAGGLTDPQLIFPCSQCAQINLWIRHCLCRSRSRIPATSMMESIVTIVKDWLTVESIITKDSVLDIVGALDLPLLTLERCFQREFSHSNLDWIIFMISHFFSVSQVSLVATFSNKLASSHINTYFNSQDLFSNCYAKKLIIYSCQDLVVKTLDSKFRVRGFNTNGWLQGQLSLPSF